jgi:preprotein translocase subunit SecB
MSKCFIYFSCCQKLKQEARPLFPHKFATDLFPKLKLEFQKQLSGLTANAKENYFKIHLTMQIKASPNPQEKVVHVQ